MIKSDKILHNIKSNSLGQKLLFFVIWPFGAFLHSLTEVRKQSSRIIIFLWFLVFGIGFTAQNEAADSFRYVEDFKQEQNYGAAEYWNTIEEYFTFESNIKDLYATTLNYTISRFTDNYHYLFLIIAFFFAIFYVKSLGYFLKLPGIKNKYLFYCLLFLFCFSNPIFNINGFRFWTATWMGVWLMFKVMVDGNYKYIPFIFILPLIHGGFSVYILLFFIILLTKKYSNFWIPIFIISCFVSAVSFLNLLDGIKDFLPQFMQNQIWSYTESDTALYRMEGGGDALYARILNMLPQYFLLLVMLLFVKERKVIQNNKISMAVFGFLLIWMSFVNFTMSIPSVGGRFIKLAVPFVAFLWLYNYDSLKKYNWLIYIIPIIYSYKILYWYRNMISISDIDTYFTPLPVIIIKNLL